MLYNIISQIIPKYSFSVPCNVMNLLLIYCLHVFLNCYSSYKPMLALLLHGKNYTCYLSSHGSTTNQYAQHVTDRIFYLLNKHIPNKLVHIRTSDLSWLTNNIKRLMRKRKQLYDKYKRSRNQTDFNNYKQVRNDVTFQIRKAKNKDLDKLKNKLKDPNIC